LFVSDTMASAWVWTTAVRVDEAVQQRLDRRPHAAGILQRVGEITDHLLVAHVLPLEQRSDVVHPHAGEVLAWTDLRSEPLPSRAARDRTAA